MSLEHLIEPESKKVLRKVQREKKNHNDGSMSKGQRSQMIDLPMVKSRTI